MECKSFIGLVNLSDKEYFFFEQVEWVAEWSVSVSPPLKVCDSIVLAFDLGC